MNGCNQDALFPLSIFVNYNYTYSVSLPQKVPIFLFIVFSFHELLIHYTYSQHKRIPIELFHLNTEWNNTIVYIGKNCWARPQYYTDHLTDRIAGSKLYCEWKFFVYPGTHVYNVLWEQRGRSI